MENLENKIYSFDEAVKESTEYFKGDEMAATNFVNKYSLKDSSENIYENSPNQMHKRLAKEIARIENKYPNSMNEDKIYSLIKDFKYIIPQGGPMSGIGNNHQIVSLSNCFVIGNESDSYGGIMQIDQEQVQLMKRRGGVGHDLSHIRPKGTSVKNSALTSTGVVPFMERYSNSTREVAQDGRRGALMLSLSIKHPDAEDFIDAKLEEGKITGANVSIKIDDEFMDAVTQNKTYIQKWPIDSENPKIKKEINAKKLWDKIVHNAWEKAEPGILFWDTIIKESIPDCYINEGYKTISTNPCGEIPLCPYDSCRLLSINLYSYVNKPFTKEANFDFELFKEHVKYGHIISDDIITLEVEKITGILEKIKSDPENELIKSVEKNLWENIKHKSLEGRRMGYGITGEGDMLAALGLKYGTDDATNFSVKVHKTLAVEAYRSSVILAKERGKFEIYDPKKEENNPFIQRLKKEDENLYQEMIKHGRRNISLLTIAPTGTTSQMTQTTSGIEPVFLPTYKRRRKVNPNDKNVKVAFIDDKKDSWEEYNVFHHKFKTWLEINGFDFKKVKNDDKKLEELVKQSPYYQATSNDVDWVAKVKMQGAIQKWVDHSISVTVNLPEDISEEKVGKVYEEAWKAGCKGVTVYRDGSRQGVLIKNGKNLEEKITLIQKNVKLDKRLDLKSDSKKYKVKRDSGSLHFILTSDLYVDDKNKKAYFIPDEDFQIRAPTGAASSVSFLQSGMDRTMGLRAPNPDFAEIVYRLQSVYSNELEGIGPTVIKSVEHAAGLVFEDYFKRNGLIGNDEKTGKLINLVKKSELRKVDRRTEEYLKIISQSNLNNSQEEISVDGNHGELGFKFECEKCGGTEYHFEDGCDNPICSCGWFDIAKSCG